MAKINDIFLPDGKITLSDSTKFVRLGREIKISPKSLATLDKDLISVSIKIGESHYASLIMSKETWDELLKWEEIKVDTLKQFKKRYL
jgi:hypothetical protein